MLNVPTLAQLQAEGKKAEIVFLGWLCRKF